MREILFRAQKVCDKKWVYGDLVQRRSPTGLVFIECKDEHTHCLYTVEPSTVGQFTGLTDKDGKKIFEGDIIKWCRNDIVLRDTAYQPKAYVFGDELVVRHLESGFTLSTKSNHHSEPNIVGNVNSYDFWNMHRFFEVVGNIYDNPELLGDTP